MVSPVGRYVSTDLVDIDQVASFQTVALRGDPNRVVVGSVGHVTDERPRITEIQDPQSNSRSGVEHHPVTGIVLHRIAADAAAEVAVGEIELHPVGGIANHPIRRKDQVHIAVGGFQHHARADVVPGQQVVVDGQILERRAVQNDLKPFDDEVVSDRELRRTRVVQVQLQAIGPCRSLEAVFRDATVGDRRSHNPFAAADIVTVGSRGKHHRAIGVRRGTRSTGNGQNVSLGGQHLQCL